MRRLILPLVALLLAGTATFGVRAWLEQRERPPIAAAPPPEQRQAVLVAAVDLATGSFVQPDSMRWQDWPDVAVPDSYLVRGEGDGTELVGAVVRRPIDAGQPLATGSVVKPGERGFLAAVLERGMRAISVPVDEAAGNAGLVLPGDRVDLILTQTISAEGDLAGSRRVSETVLSDLRVIAMGRRLTGGDGRGEEGESVQQARTATLEATPAAAEKIALVAELGKLALSLRSLATPEPSPVTASGREPTWDLDASPALRPENQPRSTLTVIRGEKLENVSVRRGAGS
jgi:pilus assembly protein CpaB